MKNYNHGTDIVIKGGKLLGILITLGNNAPMPTLKIMYAYNSSIVPSALPSSAANSSYSSAAN